MYVSVSFTWSQPKVEGRIPGARDGHSACIINGCMYIFGGYEESIRMFTQDVYCIDLTTYKWSHIKTVVSKANLTKI